MANSFFSNMNQNVVKDEDAPFFYSQRAIWIFSILFSALFGAILLAINLSKTESKKGVTLVIVFGVLYTAAVIWFLNATNANSSGAYLFGMIGAIALRYLFWDRYIGADTLYRARPVWVPSIIGVLLSALFVLAIVYGGQ